MASPSGGRSLRHLCWGAGGDKRAWIHQIPSYARSKGLPAAADVTRRRGCKENPASSEVKESEPNPPKKKANTNRNPSPPPKKKNKLEEKQLEKKGKSHWAPAKQTPPPIPLSPDRSIRAAKALPSESATASSGSPMLMGRRRARSRGFMASEKKEKENKKATRKKKNEEKNSRSPDGQEIPRLEG